MMSGEAIVQLSREAALKAAAEGKEPLRYWPGDDPFAAPFLGDYVPDEWRNLEVSEVDVEALPESSRVQYHHDDIGDDTFDLFVDSSGFSSNAEPALTPEAFQAVVDALSVQLRLQGKSLGIGVAEAGQFQVYIRCYVRAA